MIPHNIVRYSLALAGLIAAWVAFSASGLLGSLRFPSPTEVLDAARTMQPTLTVHARATSSLILIGFLIGLVLAWTIAILALISRYGATTMGVITDLLRGIPPVCLIPFFILWFGFAPSGKLVLIALNVALVVYPAIVDHLRRVDHAYLDAWNSFGRSWSKFVLKEGVRASAAAMLPTYRFSLSFALMLAIISEAMGATEGLGHVITVALNTFSLAAVVAASLAAAVIGVLLDVLFLTAFRFLFPWVQRTL